MGVGGIGVGGGGVGVGGVVVVVVVLGRVVSVVVVLGGVGVRVVVVVVVVVREGIVVVVLVRDGVVVAVLVRDDDEDEDDDDDVVVLVWVLRLLSPPIRTKLTCVRVVPPESKVATIFCPGFSLSRSLSSFGIVNTLVSPFDSSSVTQSLRIRFTMPVIVSPSSL